MEASGKSSSANTSLACKGRQNISGRDASKTVASKTLRGRLRSQAFTCNQWETTEGSTFEKRQDQILFREVILRMDWTAGSLGAKGLIKGNALIQVRYKEAWEEVVGRYTTSESDVVALVTYRERSQG